MIKNLFTFLALITLSSIAGASSFVIDQHNDSLTAFQGYTSASGFAGQSFSPTANALDHIELQLNAQTSTAAAVHVELYDAVGGTNLGTSNTLSFTGTTLELAHFEFSLIDISAYTSLFMQIVAESGTFGAFLAGGFGANSYLGGQAYAHTIAATGFRADDDLWFRTGVSEVPVPAAIFMFAPALLGFLGIRRKRQA
ncbi:MAG: hypothetical protein ACKE8R_06895 [Methylophagaceae bacterium]